LLKLQFEAKAAAEKSAAGKVEAATAAEKDAQASKAADQIMHLTGNSVSVPGGNFGGNEAIVSQPTGGSEAGGRSSSLDKAPADAATSKGSEFAKKHPELLGKGSQLE